MTKYTVIAHVKLTHYLLQTQINKCANINNNIVNSCYG